MSRGYMEIVHARIRPGAESDMLALRPDFVAAMRRAVPGLVDARLVRLEDGTWLDVVTWASQADAKAAVAAHEQVPEAAQMGTYITEILGIQQGVVVEPSPAAR
jgi:Antibiotic biosynthesis monooxygenase